MKTRFLDENYPKVAAFGGLRQGTLTFARACLREKRRLGLGRLFRIWSFRHPAHGRKWHCLAPNNGK